MKIEEWLKNEKGPLLGVLVLVVVALGGLYIYQHPRRQMAPSVFGNPFSGQSTVAEQAKQGELLKQMPLDLLLDQNAKLYFSTAMETAQGLRLTKVFNSQLSVGELGKLYQEVLVKKGWILGQQSTITADRQNLFFRKDRSELAVTIVKTDTGSALTLSYYPSMIVNRISPSASPVASPVK